MWQNVIVAVAFMLAAAWVAWSVVLPRTVRNHIRTCVGAPTPQGGGGSASCGGCCGGCGSDKPPAAGK
jgi:hypothetical protein